MLIFPIATDRKRREFPAVTVALIFINTFVLVLQSAVGDREALRWAFTPARGDLLTIFTAAFMHGDLSHLLFNMLFLWVFGSVVEDALGRPVYGLFYVGGAVAAALLHWLVVHTMTPREAFIPMLGASGAVAAVLAMFAVRFYRNRVRIFWILGVWWRGTFLMPSLWAVGIWFAMELLSGFLSLRGGSGVAHWAHIGGFLFGVGMGFVMRSPQDAARQYLLEDVRTSLTEESPQSAIERLLPAVRSEPRNEAARIQLARAYEQAGDEENADEQWRLVLQQRLQERRRGEVVPLLRQAGRPRLLSGADARTLFDVACCWEESGEYEEAARLFQQVWQQHAQAPEAELAMLRHATLLKERLKHPAADRLFDHFLQRYPHSQYRAFAQERRGGNA